MKKYLKNGNFIPYSGLIILSIISCWFMGASVVEEYDNKQPVTSEQMIQMGLKLTFYPENIKNKYEFT